MFPKFKAQIAEPVVTGQQCLSKNAGLTRYFAVEEDDVNQSIDAPERMPAGSCHNWRDFISFVTTTEREQKPRTMKLSQYKKLKRTNPELAATIQHIEVDL